MSVIKSTLLIRECAGLRDALSVPGYVQVYYIAELAKVLCQLALKKSRTMNPQPVFAWEFIDLSRPHQTINSPGQPLQVEQDTIIECHA